MGNGGREKGQAYLSSPTQLKEQGTKKKKITVSLTSSCGTDRAGRFKKYYFLFCHDYIIRDSIPPNQPCHIHMLILEVKEIII